MYKHNNVNSCDCHSCVFARFQEEQRNKHKDATFEQSASLIAEQGCLLLGKSSVETFFGPSMQTMLIFRPGLGESANVPND